MNKSWKPNWHNATEELPPREENGSGDVSICVLVTDGKEKWLLFMIISLINGVQVLLIAILKLLIGLIFGIIMILNYLKKKCIART